MPHAEILDDEDVVSSEQPELTAWVMEQVQEWRDHYQANFAQKDDEYYRLFRGIWAAEDKTRNSERSRLIAPALQQAVESNVAEIEEATFGRGVFFVIEDDREDPEVEDLVKLRQMMHRDFSRNRLKQAVSECILNAAIFGNGIGEIVLDTVIEQIPATEPGMNGEVTINGVRDVERVISRLIPVMPKHFLIDPGASSVEDGLGCAIDRPVPSHQIKMLQEKGVYRLGKVETDTIDRDKQADIELVSAPKGQTQLTKYYGLVPRDLLKAAQETDEVEEDVVKLVDDEDSDDESYYVEAVVIIADDSTLLKAEQNPNMINGDRNVVAFAWDKTPSRFRGRGVCEKGYNSQKALDAEIRARIDALGLTVHPMMGMDAGRMPRGANPTVQPGKIVLTNGNPQEILYPFNFGNVSQITFPQAQSLQAMVQQATGAVDTSGGNINGDQAAAAMSMSTGAVVKRHKRTQLNFEESFLVPLITKIGYRYMQYQPEEFPTADYQFIVKGSLGIVAREYEVSQLVQLLQTMSDDSPVKPLLLDSIVNHMNVSNREEISAAIKASMEQTPEQKAAQEATQKAQLEFQASQTAALNGQAEESAARAKKYGAETKAVPVELENDRIRAISTNLKAGEEDDRAFEQRFKVAQLMLQASK